MLYFKLNEEILTTLTMVNMPSSPDEEIIVRCKILNIHCSLISNSSTFNVEVLEILNEKYNKRLRKGIVLDIPQVYCKKIYKPSTKTFDELLKLQVPKMNDESIKELATMLFADFQLNGEAQPDLISMASPVHGTIRYIRPDTSEIFYCAPNNPNFSKALIFCDGFMWSEDENNWVKFLD